MRKMQVAIKYENVIFKVVIFQMIMILINGHAILHFLLLFNLSTQAVLQPAVPNYDNVYKLVENDAITSSIAKWDMIDADKKFSILSMHVDHHSDGSWYVPSMHDKFSVGWNRSTEKGFLEKPNACNLRFYGVGLETTFSGFEDGGTGYLNLTWTLCFPILLSCPFIVIKSK